VDECKPLPVMAMVEKTLVVVSNTPTLACWQGLALVHSSAHLKRG